MIALVAGLTFVITPVALMPGFQDPSSLTVLDAGLPDGASWTLGPNAVGRPFLVQVILANEGARPIVLWDPKCTEGAGCASVVLTDENGKATILKPIPPPRAGGVATFVTIEPNKVVIYELELLRLVSRDSLPPGRYTLTAVYENRLKSTRPQPEVWTGKIQSPPTIIQIVPPQ